MSDSVKSTEHGKDSSSTSSEEGSDEEIQVETLIAGRDKRVTAGNRLSSLLEKEGDDDLELLFAEDEAEEDVEFEGNEGEDASDVQLDSSSDDDDQGPTAAPDDFEGEKEIQKQDRQEARKKQKAQEIFKRPPVSRIKAKIDPTTNSTIPTTPLPRPKKKSERVSWLPTQEEGPVRSSTRKQTIQNKEVVHQRMQESEKRRRQAVEVMEQAAKRKDAAKPKAMTQADRMAEAARREKKNARSLNRWEETERKRAEDQKARLAALHNRQLQGPFIRWWSGPSKWVNGSLVHVGVEKMEEIHDITVADHRKGTDTGQEVVLDVVPSTKDHTQTADSDTPMPDAPPPQLPVSESVHATLTGSTSLPSLVYSAPLIRGPAFLDGVYSHSTLPGYRVQTTSATEAPASEVPANAPPPPPVTEYLSRNLVILENIDLNAVRIPELQTHVLLAKGKKVTGKLPSKAPSKASINFHRKPTQVTLTHV